MKKFVFILIIFILTTIIFTYPLVFKISSVIPGFHSTDESYAALWNFWWLKYIWQNHLPSKTNSLIAVPFGINSCESGYPLWNFINQRLSILTNNVFTYNFEILFSFLASALFMYYLAYYLNGNQICSIISAIIYAFCPYHFARAWQHLGLAQIQWIPLYILALLKLRQKTDLKHIILATLALFLVFSFDLYYAYFMLIVTLLFVIFLLGVNWRKKIKSISYLKNDAKIIRMLFISVILVFLLISPSLYLVFKNRSNYATQGPSVYNPYLRPFEDLFAQSAKPLSYFLPATVHPIFGQFTEKFIGSSLYGESFTEHTLYLGWIPLILAFVAFRKWKKERNLRVTLKEDFNIGFFIFLAIAAWLFSQPPWWNIFGFKLYMPSFFMYKIAPMFRAYSRFGIVVMLAVAVLAGLGLKFVLEKFKTWKAKITIAILFCGLVLFEFWNYPPFKIIDVSKVPDAYYWLKEQPADFIIAEYPLDTNGANEMYRFCQTKHEKKIINATTPGTYANDIAKNITKLSDLHTAWVLKWMGVKYVLVHKDDYLNTGLTEDIEDLNKIPQNPGLKLVKNFPAQECPQKDIMCIQKTGLIDIYEVIAHPTKPKIGEK